MARRYARIDVDFFHKGTCANLRRELGELGPMVFLALILRAKDGNPPGTFAYPSEAIGWERLGFRDIEMPFTLDAFFDVTGRCKQTARRRQTHGKYVALTKWEEWQKESRRWQERDKKARNRAQKNGDTQGTDKGTARGTVSGHKGGPRTRTRTTPKPPLNGDQTSPDPDALRRIREIASQIGLELPRA